MGQKLSRKATFEWRYTKDGDVDARSDKAWVDQVYFDQNGGYQEWSSINNASDSGEVDSNGDGLIDLVEYLVAGSSLSQDGSDPIALDANTREFTLRRDSANADLIDKWINCNRHCTRRQPSRNQNLHLSR